MKRLTTATITILISLLFGTSVWAGGAQKHRFLSGKSKKYFSQPAKKSFRGIASVSRRKKVRRFRSRMTLKFEVNKFKKLTPTERMEYLAILENVAYGMAVDLEPATTNAQHKKSPYRWFEKLIFDSANAGKMFFNRGCMIDDGRATTHNFDTSLCYSEGSALAPPCPSGQGPCALYFGLSGGKALCAPGNSTPNCLRASKELNPNDPNSARQNLSNAINRCLTNDDQWKGEAPCPALRTDFEKQTSGMEKFCRNYAVKSYCKAAKEALKGFNDIPGSAITYTGETPGEEKLDANSCQQAGIEALARTRTAARDEGLTEQMDRHINQVMVETGKNISEFATLKDDQKRKRRYEVAIGHIKTWKAQNKAAIESTSRGRDKTLIARAKRLTELSELMRKNLKTYLARISDPAGKSGRVLESSTHWNDVLTLALSCPTNAGESLDSLREKYGACNLPTSPALTKKFNGGETQAIEYFKENDGEVPAKKEATISSFTSAMGIKPDTFKSWFCLTDSSTSFKERVAMGSQTVKDIPRSRADYAKRYIRDCANQLDVNNWTGEARTDFSQLNCTMDGIDGIGDLVARSGQAPIVLNPKNPAKDGTPCYLLDKVETRRTASTSTDGEGVRGSGDFRYLHLTAYPPGKGFRDVVVPVNVFNPQSTTHKNFLKEWDAHTYKGCTNSDLPQVDPNQGQGVNY